jgi:hypothetical protein
MKPNRNCFKPTSFGSVWFFRTKTSSNRFGSVFSVWLGYFKILIGLIGFFSQFDFFSYFFSSFLDLIGFLVFLLTPIHNSFSSSTPSFSFFLHSLLSIEFCVWPWKKNQLWLFYFIKFHIWSSMFWF